MIVIEGRDPVSMLEMVISMVMMLISMVMMLILRDADQTSHDSDWG